MKQIIKAIKEAIVETWRTAGGVPGDAYFDNVRLSLIPEPPTLVLAVIASLGVLGFARHRRNREADRNR